MLSGGASNAPLPREYGRGGLFGVLTPQANPVAEPELRILLPGDSAMLAGRLTSPAPTLRRRLEEYRERLEECIEQFGTIRFDAVGVACTGSSYETDPAQERERLRQIGARKGYPVITAAEALEAALQSLKVSAVALVSPYPAWLTDACRRHWEGRGMRITAVLQLSAGGTQEHRIYSLESAEILGALGSFDTRGAQALLLAGTGMASLRVIRALEPALGVPVLSSNLCLAWALARTTAAVAPGPESRLFGGWAARLEGS
jgi:maleate isomerase